MDALFHFVFALVGGYILVKGLGGKYKLTVLVFLSVLSILIDIDHFIGVKIPIFHNIFLAIILPSILLLILYFYKKEWTELHIYIFVFIIMLFGHLLADMIIGMYGIPLFYPLSNTLYMIPRSWEVYLGNGYSRPLASTTGIAMAIYFGLIGFVVGLGSFNKYLEKKKYQKTIIQMENATQPR